MRVAIFAWVVILFAAVVVAQPVSEEEWREARDSGNVDMTLKLLERENAERRKAELDRMQREIGRMQRELDRISSFEDGVEFDVHKILELIDEIARLEAAAWKYKIDGMTREEQNAELKRKERELERKQRELDDFPDKLKELILRGAKPELET